MQCVVYACAYCHLKSVPGLTSTPNPRTSKSVCAILGASCGQKLQETNWSTQQESSQSKRPKKRRRLSSHTHINYTSTHIQTDSTSAEFKTMTMEPDHPLVAAAHAYLEVIKTEATNAATQAKGHPVLLCREFLRVSTHFSGMGGGELASYLIGSCTGLGMHLIGQCDVAAEARHAAWLPIVHMHVPPLCSEPLHTESFFTYCSYYILVSTTCHSYSFFACAISASSNSGHDYDTS